MLASASWQKHPDRQPSQQHEADIQADKEKKKQEERRESSANDKTHSVRSSKHQEGSCPEEKRRSSGHAARAISRFHNTNSCNFVRLLRLFWLLELLRVCRLFTLCWFCRLFALLRLLRLLTLCISFFNRPSSSSSRHHAVVTVMDTESNHAVQNAALMAWMKMAQQRNFVTITTIVIILIILIMPIIVIILIIATFPSDIRSLEPLRTGSTNMWQRNLGCNPLKKWKTYWIIFPSEFCAKTD